MFILICIIMHKYYMIIYNQIIIMHNYVVIIYKLWLHFLCMHMFIGRGEGRCGKQGKVQGRNRGRCRNRGDANQ